MAEGHFTLNEAEVGFWVMARGGPVMADIERRASRVQRVQQAYVRKRTGYLLSTIRKQPIRSHARPGWSVIAGNKKTPYTLFEDQGTRPHIIKPKNRQFLRFVSRSGQVVFAKIVHHPGTRGSYFVERSMIYAAG